MRIFNPRKGNPLLNLSLKLAISLIVGSIILSCASVPSAEKSGISHGGIFSRAPWFQGSLAEGLHEARRLKQPIFLYWGAVWCPPCNEVKANIFSHPEFPGLLTNVVTIALDGDSENAQKAGEEYKVSGYPTLLVLDYSGKELMRIGESLDFLQFKEALNAALTSSKTLKDLVIGASTNKLTLREWQSLAGYSWYDSKDFELSGKKAVELTGDISRNVPFQLKSLKALIVGRHLTALAENPIEKTKYHREAKKNREKLLNTLWETPETTYAARATLMFDFPKVLNFLYSNDEKKKLEKKRLLWIESLESLSHSRRLSLDSQVWLWNAKIDSEKFLSSSEALDPRFVNLVQEDLNKIESEAKTQFERIAVIPSISYVLLKLGAVKDAREILEDELDASPVPWYLQSNLSRLEEKQGNRALALKWSSQARESAEGRASKIQWIAIDIQTIVRLAEKGTTPEIGEPLSQFYEEVYREPDGFSGRNATRLKEIREVLKPYRTDPVIEAILTENRKRCSSLPEKDQKTCTDHFDV